MKAVVTFIINSDDEIALLDLKEVIESGQLEDDFYKMGGRGSVEASMAIIKK